MPVKPAEPRYIVVESAEALSITIPSKKRWYLILFLGFWLIMWATLGSAVVFGSFTKPANAPPDLFRVVWSVGWVVGIGYVGFMLLWFMAGAEVIKINEQGISLRKQILGLGRTKDYAAEYIRELQVAPLRYSPFMRSEGMGYYGLAGGQIAFDYGAKTIRFGAGIDEAEARMIVGDIRQRFHRYQRK